MSSTGTLFIVSAPSGAGKTSLVNALVERDKKLCVSVSHTTRPIRPGETNGINYHFCDQANFDAMLSNDEFLEHAQVFGNSYGTSRIWVEQQLALGIDVILEIDWQGARQIKRLMPQSLSIFILPPSRITLQERLTTRGQDEAATIRARMDEAVQEMSHYADGEYLLVNNEFSLALDQLEAIVVTQRLRTERQQHDLERLLLELLA